MLDDVAECVDDAKRSADYGDHRSITSNGEHERTTSVLHRQREETPSFNSDTEGEIVEMKRALRPNLDGKSKI